MKSNRIIHRIIVLIVIFPVSIIGQRACTQKISENGWKHVSIDASLPGTSWGTSAFTLADYDRDGDLDITLSRREISGGQVYWYKNNNGTWERHILVISDMEQQSVVSTYVNNDGYPDLVISR